MNKEILIWLNCTYFCGGIVVDKSWKVIEVPPILFKLSRQFRDAADLILYLKKKKQLLEYKIIKKERK